MPRPRGTQSGTWSAGTGKVVGYGVPIARSGESFGEDRNAVKWAYEEHRNNDAG